MVWTGDQLIYAHGLGGCGPVWVDLSPVLGGCGPVIVDLSPVLGGVDR